MQNTGLVLPPIKPYKFRNKIPDEKITKKEEVLRLPKIVIQGSKKKSIESVSNYLDKKRQQFLRQYDFHLREDEIKSLIEKVEKEEEQLSRAEKELKEERKRCEEQLQNCKTKALEWSQKAEDQVAKKLDKTREMKHLENQISNIKSEISKMEDSLEEFRIYENFLSEVFSSQFSSGILMVQHGSRMEYNSKDLFGVFHQIRQQNLNILKILIREEQVEKDAIEYYDWLQNIINNSINDLKNEESVWKNKIEILNKNIIEITEKQKLLVSQTQADKMGQLMPQLDNKVKEVYKVCINVENLPDQLTTMDMLMELENHLEETMKKIRKLPQDQVQIKQKICVQNREEMKRRRRLMMPVNSSNDCPRCQQRRQLNFYN